MPQKINIVGDLGTTKLASDSYDVDNIYLTEEGWVYRHFKSTDGSRYWDEIIVAGEVPSTDSPEATNPPKLGTVASPSYLTGDGNHDIDYAVHQVTGTPGSYTTKVVTVGGGLGVGEDGNGAGGGGGGGTGGPVDIINIAPPAGGSVESNGSITIDEGDATLTASTTGSGTGATYAWTATGDASIKSGADQASAVVTLTYNTGTGAATVTVTDSDTDGNSETLTNTTTFNVNDPAPPAPVIGTVTPTGKNEVNTNESVTYDYYITGGNVDKADTTSSVTTDIVGATVSGMTVTYPDSPTSGTVTVNVSAAGADDTGASLAVTVTDPAPGGGTGGALDEINIDDPTGGVAVEGFQTYTLTASNTGGDTGATYAWTVTGDAKIIGASDQASVEVELEYTGGNDNADKNGTAAATVSVTAADNSETIQETANLIVLKPFPVIGSVTPSSSTDPIRATEPSNWSTTVTLGIDSGPTESENTVWSTNPSNGVTIVQDGTNQATITFPDQQSYSVTAELTRTNSRGDSDPVSGSASISPNAAPTPSTTYTYDVVVNGSNKYVLTGEGLTDAETPTLTIAEGDTIIFKQGDASNAGHPINIYRNADKSGLAVQGVSQVGTPGNGSNDTQTVYLNLDGAGTYYYQCENHANMGGQITVTA